VALYRELLDGAEDGSIVVATVGQLTGLAGLLDSSPDGISATPGLELARTKVRLLVTMGLGFWPAGEDGWNWRCDIPAAARVLNDWPGPLAVMPHGADVRTGARLVATAPAANPVRRIYELYAKGNPHPSWDQCTVLYAVNGPGELWGEKTGYRLWFDGLSGRHEWREDASSPHVYVEQVAPSERIADVVDELMYRLPTRC
jgi:hypothetical protein